MGAYIMPPLCQLPPGSTMGNINSQPKSTNSATSPVMQTDGVGIAAAAGQMTADLSISSAKNLNREEVQNTSPAENRSGEEAKDTSEKKIQYPIRRGHRNCSSFIQTGNCKFGSKCWYNHPQRSSNNPRGLRQLRPGSTMGNVNSQPKSTNYAASPVPQTDDGVGIAVAVGHVIADHSISSAGENSEIAAVKNLNGEEVQNTSSAENRSGEEAKDTSKEKIQFPIRRGQRDCSSFVQTGNCKFGSKCWYNHPQRSANNLYYSQGRCRSGKEHKLVHSDKQTDVSSFELNFLGLPLRPGENDCFSYMETGSCKIATRCKYNHPDPIAVSGEDLQSENQSGGSSQLHASESLPFGSQYEGLPFYGAALPYVPGVTLPSQGPYPNSQWNGYQASPYPLYSSNMSSGPPTIPLNDNTPRYAPNMSSGPPTLPVDDIPRSIDVSVHHETPSDGNPERPRQEAYYHLKKTGNRKFKSACKFRHPKN